MEVRDAGGGQPTNRFALGGTRASGQAGGPGVPRPGGNVAQSCAHLVPARSVGRTHTSLSGSCPKPALPNASHLKSTDKVSDGRQSGLSNRTTECTNVCATPALRPEAYPGPPTCVRGRNRPYGRPP